MPLLMKFWIIQNRIRNYFGKHENNEELATELEIEKFFKMLDNRSRNQGIADDRQNKWPHWVKKDEKDGDIIENFNKGHVLNGMLGGNECGENFPLIGLGMMEPVGLLTELSDARNYDYTIIVLMDGKKDNIKVGP